MASWGLVLDQAIPAQLRKTHRIISGAPKRWPVPPPGGSLYLVVDDTLLRALKVQTPQQSGFELVARRDYSGITSFSLLTYRPVLRGR
jgi:hypothetical protein